MNVQGLMNNLLKAGDKIEIRSENLYQSVSMDSILLPPVTLEIISSKSIDKTNPSDENEFTFSKT